MNKYNESFKQKRDVLNLFKSIIPNLEKLLKGPKILGFQSCPLRFKLILKRFWFIMFMTCVVFCSFPFGNESLMLSASSQNQSPKSLFCSSDSARNIEYVKKNVLLKCNKNIISADRWLLFKIGYNYDNHNLMLIIMFEKCLFENNSECCLYLFGNRWVCRWN